MPIAAAPSPAAGPRDGRRPNFNVVREGPEMSKYDALWEYVQRDGRLSFQLTFDEIREISATPIDHSFLTYKKELAAYGYRVGRISLKEQTVVFNRIV
jgi:hypothetical protein